MTRRRNITSISGIFIDLFKFNNFKYAFFKRYEKKAENKSAYTINSHCSSDKMKQYHVFTINNTRKQYKNRLFICISKLRDYNYKNILIRHNCELEGISNKTNESSTKRIN